MSQKPFFISTAIPYVNAEPHLGFALEIIQADVVARYHRLLSEEVFFLTGTDENSLKNIRAAEKEGVLVKDLVDRNAQRYYELKKSLDLSFNDFIRTTQERHKRGAQKFWLACQKDIYKKTYRGLYCVGCEEFYKEKELENGLCPEHRKKPELIDEENYFFRLSKYEKDIKKIIEQNLITIIPETRKNEVLSFIDQGLEDICISRSNKRAKGWGIDVPGDPQQKMWCWIDALTNYITALDYATNDEKFQKFWQNNNNKVHIVGKGILKFHAVYWIGFLLSAKLSLPNTIFVHGYITCEGQKMSKSLGNVLSPFEIVEKFGTDPLRYYLLREIPATKDGDFSQQRFKERYNADLASGLGNLVARITAMAESLNLNFGKQKSKLQPKTESLIQRTWQNYNTALNNFKFNETLEEIWRLIRFCDRYIEENKVWEQTPKQAEHILELLTCLVEISKMLRPFLPQTSQKIASCLGINLSQEPPYFFKPKKSSPLFPRL